LATTACSSPPKTSDLGGIYNELAQHDDPYRNPIVLIPGVLGSKLVDPQTGVVAWGTFGFRRANPNTDKTAQLDHNGNLTMVETAPGDSVVLRSSALMDERRPDNRTSRLMSPIKWNQVIFLFSDHRGITKDPAFTDNLLYILLESPKSKE
jgi:hypothetical protein